MLRAIRWLYSLESQRKKETLWRKSDMRHFPLWWVLHTKEERKRLKKEISEHGILEPIKISKIGSVILDGNLRYEIARELGIDVPFTYARFSDLFYLTIRNTKRLFKVLYHKMKDRKRRFDKDLGCQTQGTLKA